MLHVSTRNGNHHEGINKDKSRLIPWSVNFMLHRAYSCNEYMNQNIHSIKYVSWYHYTPPKLRILRNFRLPLRCKWELLFLGILCRVGWQFNNAVSGQPIGPIFEAQAGSLVCLTREPTHPHWEKFQLSIDNKQIFLLIYSFLIINLRFRNM